MAEQTIAARLEDTAQERVYAASQWQLMWWRFRKHKVAIAALIVLLVFYFIAIAAEFLATTETRIQDTERSYISPQPIHWFDGWKFSPHVFPVKGERDPISMKRVYTVETEERIPVRFFARDFEYRFAGIIPTDRHLIGVPEGYSAYESINVFGTDKQGRDLYSRLMLAVRISMTIGLLGVCFSLVLGIVLGGISGFYGGIVDTVIQRVIEIVRSIPTIPLWMGPRRIASERLVHPEDILRYYDHHLTHRMDRARARRARALPVTQGRRLRRRRRARRSLPDAHHLPAHGPLFP